LLKITIKKHNKKFDKTQNKILKQIINVFTTMLSQRRIVGKTCPSGAKRSMIKGNINGIRSLFLMPLAISLLSSSAGNKKVYITRLMVHGAIFTSMDFF
jgi:hypothetical protein